ncbi:hypothetical protein AVENLUH13518_01722 [Acinetobacter venetianus]|uniref:Uncharacterized protein n=1 Tax=Acinetobacter venetianus TaxID=52133 RepID=A0A150HVI9_9GAMM|nr:hypothetical protein AVENLUH13518_01722 [Acinetobacter venetianus]
MILIKQLQIVDVLIHLDSLSIYSKMKAWVLLIDLNKNV